MAGGSSTRSFFPSQPRGQTRGLIPVHLCTSCRTVTSGCYFLAGDHQGAIKIGLGPWVWTLQLEPSHYSAGSDRLSAYLLAWGKPKDLCLFTCFAALRASCSPGPRHVKEALLCASVLVQYSTHSHLICSAVMNLRRPIRPLAAT